MESSLFQDFKTSSVQGVTLRELVLPQYRSNKLLLFCPGNAHNGLFLADWCRQASLDDGIRCASMEYNRKPLRADGSDRSINSLRLKHYKADVLKAVEALSNADSEVYLVAHSMGGRLLYELFYQNKLPEQVKGVVLLNPVPDMGMLGSAVGASIDDTLRSGRPTAASFPYSLLVSRNLKKFFESSPERVLSLFFSSDSEVVHSRLKSMTAREFTKTMMTGESCNVVGGVLLPSFVAPQKTGKPILIIGTEGDRLISMKSLERMHRRLSRVDPASSFTRLENISHDSPMDIEGGRALEAILMWIKGL